MASRIVLDPIPLRDLQRFHHSVMNNFNETETLVDAISARPGFYGPNPVAVLSLKARRPSLHLEDLNEALINDRTLLRVGAFRGSLFLVSTSDYPLYFRALHTVLRRTASERLEKEGITDSHLARYAHRLQEADFAMPLSHEQLMDIMYPGLEKRPGLNGERLILRKLCDKGILVRTTFKGWKGNNFFYALFNRWLPDINITTDNPEPARTELVRRYLRSYGPASPDDISWWTGLPPLHVQRVITQLGREVLRYPIEGLSTELIGLRERVDTLRNLPEIKRSIQFLPLWDAYTLGWRDRRRLVDEAMLPWIYDAAGNAVSVIVDEGRIIGLWQFRDSDRLTFEFHVFDNYRARIPEVETAAEKHAEVLAELSSARSTQIFERELPQPLSERGPGAFLWPLGKAPLYRNHKEEEVVSPMERRHTNTYVRKYLDGKYVVTNSTEGAPVEEKPATPPAKEKAKKASSKATTKKAKPKSKKSKSQARSA